MFFHQSRKISGQAKALGAAFTSLALLVLGLTLIPDANAATGVSKVLVIMEENESGSQALPAMPYLKSLATQYGQATDWSDVGHPSLPNYLAIFGGSNFGLSKDCTASQCPVSGESVFGQAIAAGKTAKVYGESQATNCEAGSSGNYDPNHNPWPNFVDEASICKQFSVPLGTPTSGNLINDINAGTLPNVGEVVPDLSDDAHNGTLAEADSYLKSLMAPILNGPDYKAGRLAVVVTFDEGQKNEQVAFVMVAPGVQNKTVSTALNHYALTRFLDTTLGTAPLRNASTAPDIAPLFGVSVGSTGGSTTTTTTKPSTTTTTAHPTTTTSTTVHTTTTSTVVPLTTTTTSVPETTTTVIPQETTTTTVEPTTTTTTVEPSTTTTVVPVTTTTSTTEPPATTSTTAPHATTTTVPRSTSTTTAPKKCRGDDDSDNDGDDQGCDDSSHAQNNPGHATDSHHKHGFKARLRHWLHKFM